MSNRALNLLKDRAERAYYWRGHTRAAWEDNADGTRSTLDCPKCGNGVAVATNPMPNEIDVGGPAVALDCTDCTELR